MFKNAIILFVLIVCFFASCKKEKDKEALVDTSQNSLVDITSQQQFNDLISQNDVALVFFHASWCAICKEQRPAVEALTMDTELNKVSFSELEYDDYKTIADGVNVTGFPTILIFKKGVEAHRLNGKGHSFDKLKGLLLN
ncbi:MAG: thioredoxin family protein [Bacteroidota bacterium]|nr:thioredoxin family protein [Bacteroidota bacterium]